MVIDPRTLTPHPLPPAGNCPNCGYDLEGLPDGAGCPECGLGREPARQKPRNRDDQLANAPVEWLRWFALGAWLLVASGAFLLMAGASWSAGVSALYRVLLLLAACCWCAGAALLTRPRPKLDRGAAGLRREWSTLRVGVRGALWALPLAAALEAAGVLPVELAIALAAVGLGNAASLAVYLARLADWAGDDARARSMRGWVMLMPPVVALAGLFAWATAPPVGPNQEIVATVLVVTGLVLVPIAWSGWFAWNVIQIAVMAGWALHGKRRALERLHRLAGGGSSKVRVCEYCGYDLFGLAYPTRCPECGEMEASAAPPLLKSAPRRDEPPIPLAGPPDAELPNR